MWRFTLKVRDVAVHAFAHVIGQPAHGQNISRAIERNAVVEIKTLMRHDLFSDRQQTSVVSSKVAHTFYDTRLGWVKIC